MKEVRTIARILGPRGLMPNPKSGTVSDDIGGAVKAITQGGRVEYKMDKQANIGVVVGKRSFTSEQITENINSVLDSLGQVKPQGIKGRYILSATLSGAMSPGIKLEPAEYSKY
jgi:large subunit ribosomal protein L1